MTNELRAAAERIADHYGLESQLDITQEELAELIQSISKLRRAGPRPGETGEKGIRYTEARGSVSEEMADVLNMLFQLMHLLRNEEIVMFWLKFKLDRTLRGMEEGSA